MIAEVIASTNRARDEDFLEGLATEGYLEQFLAKEALDSVAIEVRSRLGNTTHISVMDAEGACASVTCSNGSCSGVVVPGTGMHLNNMLGEQDLNPLGYHRHEPGARETAVLEYLRGMRELVENQKQVMLRFLGATAVETAAVIEAPAYAAASII